MFADFSRSKQRNRTRRQRKATASKASFRHRLPRFESLEQRQMLTGIPTISIDDVTVDMSDDRVEFIDAFVPNGTYLDSPRDMVLGPDGNLYVSDATDSLLRYNAVTGALIDEFVAAGSGGLDLPGGLAFGPDGNGDGGLDLYVSSTSTDSVLRYDGLTGDFIDEFIASGSGGLDYPRGLLFDSSENLYVASYSSDSVLRYDGTTGDFLGEFVAPGSGGLDSPYDLEFDSNGYLYVSSYATDSVLRYHSDGSFMDEFVAADSGGLDGPRYMTFDSDGDLYVGNGWADSVLRYDTDGSPVGDTAFVASGSGGLDSPYGVLFDSGKFYVASSITDSVLRYESDGRYTDEKPFIGSKRGEEIVDFPHGVAFDSSGDLYVASYYAQSVVRYDGTTGTFKGTFIEPGAGGMESPRTLVFGPYGDLYVTDKFNGSVLQYDGTTGESMGTIIEPDIYGITYIAFGPDGNLYANSLGNDAVLRFQQDGTFMDEFVSPGSGGLTAPAGLTFGPDGNLYVASTTGDSVLRYDSNGAFIDEFIPPGSGGLNQPLDIGFDLDDNLYVSTAGDNWALRYDGTTGEFLGALTPSEGSKLHLCYALTFDASGNLYVSSGIGDEVLRFGTVGQAAITISLSNVYDQAVTVDYSTSDGTALAGEDFTDVSGTLVFPAGVTSRTILVPTFDDAVLTPSESFLVNLSNPSVNATIADNQGEVTILAEQTPVISINDVTGIEGDDLVFTVNLSHSVDTMVTVDYATTDGTAVDRNDYTAVNGTLTFTSGVTEQTIAISTFDDSIGERDETFLVNLSNATNGAVVMDSQGQALLRVSDDIKISIGDVEVAEDNDSVQFIDPFIAENAGGLDYPTSMAYGLDGNLYVSSRSTDSVLRYDGATGTFIDEFIPRSSGGLEEPTSLTFDPNGMLYMISGPQESVLRYNSDGTFKDEFVSPGSGGLVRPSGMTFGPDGNLYVCDYDDRSVFRYDGGTGVFIDKFVGSGSGGLYYPQGLAFGPDGNLYVNGLGYANGIWSGSVLRYDGEVGSFIDEFVTPIEGSVGRYLGIEFGPDGNLYTGDRIRDAVHQYDGVTGVFIGEYVPFGSYGLDSYGDIIFAPDGNLLVANSSRDSVFRYGVASQAMVTVSLSRPCDLPVTVDYVITDGTAINGQDYTGASGSLTFAPGTQTQTVLIPTILDPANEPTETFTVNLSNPSSAGVITDADAQAKVTILADDAPRISVGDQIVLEGNSIAFTVSMSTPSDSVVSVDYTTAEIGTTSIDDYTPVSGTLTFAPGETMKTVLVETLGDAVAEVDERLSLILSNSTSGTTIIDPQGVAVIIDLSHPLFVDSFENGEWNSLWVEDSQYDWFDSTQRMTDGAVSAEVDGRTTDATLTMSNPIDMSRYGSAELTFDWYIESGFDKDEYLALDFSPDGSTWTEITRLSGNVDQEDVWHSETIAVAPIYLTEAYKLRFRATVSGDREDANVDNVKLMATSLAGPPNGLPAAIDDTTTTLEDTDVTIAVLLNDTDPDGDTLTVESVTQGALGSVTINTDNTIIYEPNANANGSDMFTYTVSDGNGGTDTGEVTVAVTAVPDAPDADAGGPYTVLSDGTVELDASGSTDAEGDALTYAWDLDGDTVFDDATGVAPTFDASGLANDAVVDIVVQVTDSTDLVSEAFTTVTVQAAPSELIIYTSTGDPINIGDLKTVSSPIVISGTGATIESLTIRIDLTHAEENDLTAMLVSPDGIELIIDSPILEGDYTQDYVIVGAKDLPLDGTWTLQVTDTDKNRKRGSLIEWTMIVEPAVAGAALLSATSSAGENTPALDTNGDGQVTPYDALLVINWLGSDHANHPTRFSETLDVNRDGCITPLDGLMVINRLNARTRTAAEGEPQRMESAATTAASLTALDQIFADMEDEEEEEDLLLAQPADDLASLLVE